MSRVLVRYHISDICMICHIFLYTFCICLFWVHFGYGIVQFSVPQKNSGNIYFLCFLNFFEVLKIAQFHIQNIPKMYTSIQNVYKMYIKQKKFLIEQHSVFRYVNDSHMIITQYVIDYTQYLM